MTSISSRDSSISRPRASPAPSSTAPSTTSGALTERPDTISDSHVSDKTDDTSKLRTFLSILRRFIGVSDIAAVRFSLPAQLLEPTPNLEYWHYLDRPETFVAIGKSDDGLGRMLEVLRFWFTKDLKYIKGKPCKPYNSVLGEFFRCNWEVQDSAKAIYPSAAKSNGSATPQRTLADSKAQDASNSSSTTTLDNGSKVRISYLTEQTSHHPPISAFYIDCPERGISARGLDQLSAKFTGTSIKVGPGSYNQGIFIKLAHRNNEEYQLTHPIAHLGGLLRGSLSVTVGDTCFITCPQTQMKTILEYLEESWLGRTQNRVKGVIYSYDPQNDNKTRVKDVPEKDIIAKIEGCWHEQLLYTPTGAKEAKVLIDLRPLMPTPKIIPPMPSQLRNESQRFWADVTTAIKEKKFSEATKAKQQLEERQREKAREREQDGTDWHPRFFEQPTEPDGRPILNQEGQEAMQRQQKGDWNLKESEVEGAL